MNEQFIPLGQIHDNPFQDREVYQDIEALGRAIAVNGLEQLPRGRKTGTGYELKFGHRRKRAFDWLSGNWKNENLPERYNGYTVMPLEVEEFTDAEMFDGVVIENVHRDDLKVTEKARLLRRYKEVHPQATSEQIGLVFNMAPATVRGMDIFLDLPEEAQAALDAGEISMGTARTLHSMQRMAPREKIVATLKRVIKEKGSTLPDKVIEHEIDALPGIVDLWNDNHQRGKARAGYHGWPLDMKKLNHLLPKMTEAQVGAHEKQIEHLVNPPACTACPFYTKVRGSHYCGLKICHDRKMIAWYRYSLEIASQKTKIPIYQEADGAYRALGWEDAYKKWFEQKHKDLRLVPKSMIPNYVHQSYTKLDDDLVVVVATGETLLGKMVLSSGTNRTKGGKKTEKEKAEMRATKIYRQRRKELMWELTGLGKAMFEGVPETAIERILRWHYVGVDDAIPETYKHGNEKGEYPRRKLVWWLIHEGSSHYSRSTMAAIVKDFQDRTGVKPTRAVMKLAEEWDAEIKDAAKVVACSVAAETDGKRTRGKKGAKDNHAATTSHR